LSVIVYNNDKIDLKDFETFQGPAWV